MSDAFPYSVVRFADGTLVESDDRDMPGYDGKGASKALELAIGRSSRGQRLIKLHRMALEQIEREQAVARESEAAE